MTSFIPNPSVEPNDTLLTIIPNRIIDNAILSIAKKIPLNLLTKNPKKKETIKPKAEYFIILEWDGEKPYDLDIWVKDNLGHVVSFRRPDDALIHLERDDLGTINDT